MTPAAAPLSSIAYPTATSESDSSLFLPVNLFVDLAGSFLFDTHSDSEMVPQPNLKFYRALSCIFSHHPI